MSTMDLKFRSIAWVGKNISNKFETMCQQVDSIVSQDAVKYVETHVQTMGGSVKKFCSDVVQDLLPPVANPVKHEVEEASIKRNTKIGGHVKSVFSSEESSLDTAIKQSLTETNSVDPVNQLGSNSLLISQQLDVDILNDPSETDVEENAIKEDKSSTSDETEVISPTESGSCEASLLSEFCVQNHEGSCGLVAVDTPATSIVDVDCHSTRKVEKICDGIQNELLSVADASNMFACCEMVCSNISQEEKLSELDLLTFSDSQVIISNSLRGDLPDNSTETVLCGDQDVVECVSNSSDMVSFYISSPMMWHKDRAESVGLFDSNMLPPLESTEEDPSKINCEVSALEFSQNGDTEFFKCVEFEALSTSSDTGELRDSRNDLSYSGMETIELGDKVKLEESTVMVDDRALYAVSYRTQKLRSFKKRIQDAFASKKRLAKEYEQLAIWFGDTYISPSQNISETRPPTISMTTNSQSLCADRICDSEWELL